MNATGPDREWVRRWLDHLRFERRLSALTVKNYHRDIEALYTFLCNAEIPDWAHVDGGHVRSFAARLHRRGQAPRSIQRRLAALRNLFDYLLREGIVSSNPGVDITAPKAPRRLPETLDADAMGRLLDVRVDHPIATRDRAIMELFYSSGLRLAELAGLQATDVDLAAHSDAFVTTLGEGVAAASIGPMLDARISARYSQRRAALRALPGLTDVTDASRSTDANGTAGGTGASVLTCDLTTWQAEAELREECFGPLIIVVRCPPSALVDAVATVPGGLTASVWSEPDDEGELALARALVTAVTDRVGRVLHDGMPTGVAVTWAQQHGGPYPATTSPGTTSVGMHAVDRFLRPVAYQDVPAALLPVWLRDDDPWSLPRRVDGRLTLPR